MSRRKLTIKVHELAKLFAKENGKDEKLCGMCGIASYVLWVSFQTWDELYNTNYNPSLMIGISDEFEGKRWIHSWVKSGKYLFDPTFLQFESKIPYFIGNNTPQHNFLSNNIKNVTDFSDYHTWTTQQMPTPEIIEWFMERMDFSHPKFNHEEDIQRLKEIVGQFSEYKEYPS